PRGSAERRTVKDAHNEGQLFRHQTSTDVLDADTNLADALLAEIRAVVEYQIAQIDLAVATGTLMGQAGVDWTPRDPRVGATRDEQEPRRYEPMSGAFGRE
ncbi:MAG: hypothetical protein AAGA55_11875, partial [Planctomycetota bacterium]